MKEDLASYWRDSRWWRLVARLVILFCKRRQRRFYFLFHSFYFYTCGESRRRLDNQVSVERKAFDRAAFKLLQYLGWWFRRTHLIINEAIFKRPYSGISRNEAETHLKQPQPVCTPIRVFRIEQLNAVCNCASVETSF